MEITCQCSYSACFILLCFLAVLGKSIVIHQANSGDARIACGNVIDTRSTDAYLTYVTPSTQFDSNDFVALASQVSGRPQSTFQYVNAYNDPTTRCTTVSFNVLGSNLTHSMQVASYLRTANLNQYTHQPKCDAYADTAASFSSSLPLLLLSVTAVLLWLL